MITSVEILNKIISHYKITYSQFGRNIGLPRAQNLYDVKNGKANISPKLANKILEAYPEINRSWLLSGEGSMINDVADSQEVYITSKSENDRLLKIIEKQTEQISKLTETVQDLVRKLD